MSTEAKNATAVDVHREALYIGPPDSPLFAWYHSADAGVPRDCVAVICPPLGHEYVHSHRSMRHLADDLARAGVPALRFDYHGTGDSPGSDLDPDRVSRWLKDIGVAMAQAQSLSGAERVCLLGVRMGASLAAMVAAQAEVDWLVLWNPATSGRRYVREMQALAQSTQPGERAPGAPLEAAGFVLTAQTQSGLQAIQLTSLQMQVRQRALIVARDDMAEDHALRDHLQGLGVGVDSIACPGYADMVAEPHHTVVPQHAIDAMVVWLQKNVPARSSVASVGASIHRQAMSYAFSAANGAQAMLTDTCCRFGENGQLFGIHTQPSLANAELPTVVLFSSGVVHRVGPNRLYTVLARNMAALGFACLRVDIEGVGDSVLRGSGRENHPYPETAARDAEAALRFLKERQGAREFVLMGLCSGAYTSFLSGVSSQQPGIREVALINPLTFQWVEGDVLDTDHFRKVAHYRGSMRSASSWMKLLRGQVNIPRLAGVVFSHLGKQIGSRLQAVLERVYPEAGSVLSSQLRQLFARGTRISMFIASGDPGWDMLNAEARRTARKALDGGALSVQIIEDADHTFTSEASRLRLLAGLLDGLARRYKQGQ